MDVDRDTYASSQTGLSQEVLESNDKENQESESIEMLRIFQHESLHSLVMPADKAAMEAADTLVDTITADLFSIAQSYKHEHRLLSRYLSDGYIGDSTGLCTVIQQLFDRILSGISAPQTNIAVGAAIQEQPVDSSRFPQIDLALVTPPDFQHAGPRTVLDDMAFGPGDIFSTDIFAPVRVVYAVDESNFALDDYESELNDQLRHVLTSQPNRMFAWGILVFGTRAHVYLLLPDYTLRSRAYSLVARIDGLPMFNTTAQPNLVLSEVLDLGSLAEFIEFFVYWATCDASLLGYDTTMEYLPDNDCWQIECPQVVRPDESSHRASPPALPAVYYASTVMLHNTYRLYGRRTRCFQAAATIDGDRTLVVKDTWALAPTNYKGSGYLHELLALKHITKCTPFRKAIGEQKFQELVCGGIVHQAQTKARPAQSLLDSGIVGPKLYSFRERTLMGWRYELVTVPHESRVASLGFKRYHQRIVTTPVAMPLEKLANKDEFTKGAAGALNIFQMMEMHGHVIHGNMKPSNLVFYTLPDGQMSGFPIDLSLAIDLEVEKRLESNARHQQ